MKNWQHQQMAQHYTSVIADYLQVFDENMHSRETYEALAWTGLFKIHDRNTEDPNDFIYSEAWKSLTEAQQQSILKEIENYRSSAPSNCK
ncbi:hypothetical protein AB9P05_22225 [Roseivirga sp. BDSF3-8]|uniref:hypothetical protein n=1 Tax=Roseivirga sp. BDSF3-8 TaxID=3241598 RepID=UPI003531F512